MYDVNYYAQQFKWNYKYLGDMVVDYYKSGTYWLTMVLEDGKKVLYDYMFDEYRFLPLDSTDMTEEEQRREFILRLQTAIRHRGFTQRNLAEAMDIPQSTINRYCTGDRTPDFYTLDRMVRILKCSMDDFRYVEK